MTTCKAVNCNHEVTPGTDFCVQCRDRSLRVSLNPMSMVTPGESMSSKYPKYYKSVEHLTEIDVYAVHHLFNVNDPSGAIQHASKKLLLSGSRNGGKSFFKDIEEARDTLTRWLQLNQPND